MSSNSDGVTGGQKGRWTKLNSNPEVKKDSRLCGSYFTSIL